jgi:hypothetical protein
MAFYSQEIDLVQLMRRACLTPVRNPEYMETWGHSPILKKVMDPPVLDSLLRWMLHLTLKHKSATLSIHEMPLEMRDEVSQAFHLLDSALVRICENASSVVPSVDDFIFRKVESLDEAALPIIISSHRIPFDLPLVDKVGDRFGNFNNVDLSRFVLVAVQHLLGSSVPVFSWLNQLGLPYERMHIIGKVYSTHRGVVSWLRQAGAHVHNASLDYEGKNSLHNRDYCRELRACTVEVIRDAIAELDYLAKSHSPGVKLLVIDDGGTAIDILQEEFDEYAPQIVAVEQTRRGACVIRGFGQGRPHFPIINIAESNAKLERESPLIGHSVAQEIVNRLEFVHDKNVGRDFPSVLVVGFGSVGEAVASALRKWRPSIMVYDNDGQKRNQAVMEGFECVELTVGLSRSRLVVGCTGFDWFQPYLTMYLQPGFVLASATTSDIEFRQCKLDIGKRHLPHPGLMMDRDSSFQIVHGDYQIETPKSSGWLFNGGFPVNFNGSVDPIAPEEIQLTRSLILAGALQAANTSGKQGLVDLDRTMDEFIVKWYAQC